MRTVSTTILNKLTDLSTMPKEGDKNTQKERRSERPWLSFFSCFLHLYLMNNVTPIRYTSLSDISI